MSELKTVMHPLAQSKLTLLRDKNTNKKEFRELVSELTALLFYEATRDMSLREVSVETPFSSCTCNTLNSDIALVPILRGGLGMVEGIVELAPNAKIGHIGLYRDPNTLRPVEYYCKLPKADDSIEIFVLEPMAATGGTASAAITFLKERGFKKIKYICLICTPEAVAKIQSEHPDADIYTAAVDRKINEEGYIIPGLGDAGDRMFGTR